MLNQLVETLKNQVIDRSSIVLNEEILSQEKVNEIRQVFWLEENEYFQVNNITLEDIPDPQGNILEIFAGRTALLPLLQQTFIAPKLIFKLEENNVISCLIALRLNEDWSFKESFLNLTDIFPFNDNVILFSDSYFIYSSQAQFEYLPWLVIPSGVVDPQNGLIDLKAGLNFASWIKLDIFSTATDWLKEVIDTNRKYKCWGTLTPRRVNPYPVIKLTAPLLGSNLNLADKLALGNPAIIIEITEPIRLIQRIGLRLAVSTEDLEFSVNLSRSSPGLSFNARPKQGREFTADKILNLPGGEDFQSFIPDELSQAFENCALRQFSIVVARLKAITFISLSIGTPKDFQWELIPDVIILENIFLQVESLNPNSFNSFTSVFLRASCQLFPNIFPGTFDFRLELEKGGGNKWEIGGISGRYYGNVPLSSLAAEIIGSDATVPEELKNINFSEFGVSIIRQGTGYSYSLFGRVEAIFPILDIQLISSLSIVATYQNPGYEMILLGAFAVKQENFRLVFKLGTSNKLMEATWRSVGNQYLQIEDIAQAFGFDENEIPQVSQGLDLSLRAANLTYNFSDQTLTIAFESANYGQAFFAVLKKSTNQKPTRQVVFGLIISNKNFNLSNLPVTGKEFPPEKSLRINDLQFFLASHNLDSEQVNSFNNLIPPTIPITIPVQPPGNNPNLIPIKKGLNISSNLQFRNTPQILALPLSSDSQATPPTPTPQPTPVTDNTKWFPLKKHLGNLYFARIGLQYKDNSLWFLLDASISSAGLTLILGGLSFGSPLKEFKPKFNLQGIGIEYESKGNISITGTLLKTTIKGKDNYSGGVIVKTKTFTISAIGSYTTTDQGYPSLFIYGILDKPIGGPPFFFVTELALGFAYNRSLTLPTLDRIPQFPLIRYAIEETKADPTQLISIQRDLQPYIAPKVGRVMVAVGIKFTSFKIIESFVLLVATFGDRFSLELLGISTLISPPIPPGVDPNTLPPPLAQVRFGILARFVPSEGILKVEGKILADSYLFDRNCLLSGGFAFYSWFKGDSKKGIVEGDFVLSVGGYHPRFQVPAHYPRVDAIALNWRISNQLSVKGSLYFALTASAIMAGGRLEAVWQSGNIKAWFIANAHFIVAWQPYFYDARIGVNLGASYTFYLFGRQTISIEVGADLHIWGPKFSGTATISLWVVSFTVRFGDRSERKPKSLTWSEFKASFLPAQNEVCSIAVESGLLRKIGEGQSEIFIVNPKEFAFTTSSVIPLKNVEAGQISIKQQTEYGVTPQTSTFGIAPMEVNNQRFTESKYSISLVKIKEDGSEETQGSNFECTPIAKNIPTGLWGESNSTDDPNKGRFINNVLSGYKIKPANPPTPGETQEIPRRNLAYDTEPVDNAYQWNLVSNFSENEEKEKAREQKIGETITSEAVKNARNSLQQSLGLSNIEIDLEEFTTNKGIEQAFIIAPQLEEAMV